MRLSELEKKSIIDSVISILGHDKVKIYLYGSRTLDSLKGGDIDLLVVATTNDDYHFLATKKYKILSSLKQMIGDQKIDLSIITELNLINDVFYSQLETRLLWPTLADGP